MHKRRISTLAPRLVLVPKALGADPPPSRENDRTAKSSAPSSIWVFVSRASVHIHQRDATVHVVFPVASPGSPHHREDEMVIVRLAKGIKEEQKPSCSKRRNSLWGGFSVDLLFIFAIFLLLVSLVCSICFTPRAVDMDHRSFSILRHQAPNSAGTQNNAPNSVRYALRLNSGSSW